MISLIFRTFTISLIILGMFFGLFYLLYGVQIETTWSPIWENYYNELPLFAIIVIGTFIISFFISLWWMIVEKSKEFTTLCKAIS